MVSLYSPKAVTEILDRHSMAPLKKLGQNFLIDENIVTKIAEAASDGGNVLEIGPGMGALTRALAKCSKKVVAVEIDAGMIRVHEETLADLENVTVLHADILKTDIKAVGEEYFGGEPFCVAGNLPYYITAKCILQVLDSGAPVTRFTAMVQREVADRLASRPGCSDYGALTASVAYYGDAEFLFPVSAGCFYPRPEVESAVVRMFPEAQFDISREDYTKAVRILFAMRRKTVQNNLKNGIGVNATTAAELLEQAGISPMERAEDLSPETYARLAAVLKNR